MNINLADQLKKLRKEKNVSQEKLASYLNISYQAVSKWENDLATPDSIKMILLAEVLETDIEYLSTGRRNYGRRPPVVINTVETVEKVVEKPVVQVVEKVVEKVVEIPMVEYVEKPIIKKVLRVKYRRNPAELCIIGAICFAIGLVVGFLL